MPGFDKEENPDWNDGFLAAHREELDEYLDMLRRDPGAQTPGGAAGRMSNTYKEPSTYKPAKKGAGGAFNTIAASLTDAHLTKDRDVPVREQLGAVRVVSRQRSRTPRTPRSRAHGGDASKVVTWSPAAKRRGGKQPREEASRTPAAKRFFGVSAALKAETPAGRDSPSKKSVRFPEGMRAPTREASRGTPMKPRSFTPPVDERALGSEVGSHGGGWVGGPPTATDSPRIAVGTISGLPVGLANHEVDYALAFRILEKNDLGRSKRSVRDWLDTSRLEFGDGRSGHKKDIPDRWNAELKAKENRKDRDTPVNVFTTALRAEVVRDRIETLRRDEDEEYAEVKAPETAVLLPEDPDDDDEFARALREHKATTEEQRGNAEDRISALEDLARERIAANLAMMEVKYDMRRVADTLNNPGGAYALVRKAKAAFERRVCGAVLKGSPGPLRRALIALALFPPDPPTSLSAALGLLATCFTTLPSTASPEWLGAHLGSLRATADSDEPLFVTATVILLAARRNEAAERADGSAVVPVDARRDGATSSSTAHASVLRALRTAGADVDAADGEGRNALHRACLGGDAEVVAFFLATLGADANKATADGTHGYPLLFACGVENRRRAGRCVVALLERGCDVDVSDSRKRNALHVAAAKGPRGLVELLLHARVKSYAKDADGRTPADAAKAAGQRSVAEFVRCYRDPVRACGGVLGAEKRLEFVETGQIRSTTDIFDELKADAADAARLRPNLTKRGLRKLRNASAADAFAVARNDRARGAVDGALATAAAATDDDEPAAGRRAFHVDLAQVRAEARGLASRVFRGKKDGAAPAAKKPRKSAKDWSTKFLTAADDSTPLTLPPIAYEHVDVLGAENRARRDSDASSEADAPEPDTRSLRERFRAKRAAFEASVAAARADPKKATVDAQHALAAGAERLKKGAKAAAITADRILWEGSARHRHTYVFEVDGDRGNACAERNIARKEAKRAKKHARYLETVGKAKAEKEAAEDAERKAVGDEYRAVVELLADEKAEKRRAELEERKARRRTTRRQKRSAADPG